MALHFDTDVLIVGGGPAGAATALSLLTYSDLNVLIIENSAFDTIRVGEQVNPSLFDLLTYLKVGKEDFEEGSFVRGYNSQAAWGNSRIHSRDSIFSTQEESYQLDREKFDLMLLSEASKRGSDIIPRAKCIDFKQTEDNHWCISVKHQTEGDFSVTAKYLVDATGRLSNVGRKLGMTIRQHDQLMAVGAFLHFDNTTVLKQDILLETVAEGWWYCATLPNQVMVATLFTDADIVKEKRLQKAENWNQLLANTVYAKNKVNQASAFGSPWVKAAFSKITDATTRKNFIAVGDAAASFDPVSSMGIGFAISSACHAANTLVVHSKGDLSSIAHYQRNIEDIFSHYLTIKAQFYRKEQRWSDAAFWQRRNVSV